MVKSGHTGKGPRQKEEYAAVVSRQPGSDTIEENESMGLTDDTDVSLGYEDEAEVPTKRRKRRKPFGINAHFKRNLHTYVTTIIAAALLLFVSLGLPIYGNIQKISNQIEFQRELNASLKDDLNELEATIASNDSRIQSKLQEIGLKLTEQAMKLEFLDELVKGAKR